MKRVLLACLSLLMLAGCTVNPSIDLQQRLQDHVEKIQNQQVQEANHTKPLYSYYLPKDFGRYESYAYGNLFCVDGVRVAMSLNTAAIINASLYPELTDSTVQLSGKTRKAFLQGEYTDIHEESHVFEIGIFDVGGTYAVGFVSDTVLLQATCNGLQSGPVASAMLRLARSVTVNTEQVIRVYSNQVPEVEIQEKVELFDIQAPENGRIEELFEDHSRIETTPSKDNTDQTE